MTTVEQAFASDEEPTPKVNTRGAFTKWLCANLRAIAIPATIFLVLTGISLYAAGQLGVDPEVAARTNYEAHTVLFYRVVFSIQITMLLLTVALCLHIFARSDSSNQSMTWRAWWTIAFVALMVHFWWSLVIMFDCDDLRVFLHVFDRSSEACVSPGPPIAAPDMFHSTRGELSELMHSSDNSLKRFGNLERVIEQPIVDLTLGLVWFADVVVAWFLSLKFKRYNHNMRRWRWPHGLAIMFISGAFFSASALAPKASWPARYMGLAMGLAVAGCFLYRTIRHEVDRKSLSWALYVWFFRVVNELPVAVTLATLAAFLYVIARMFEGYLPDQYARFAIYTGYATAALAVVIVSSCVIYRYLLGSGAAKHEAQRTFRFFQTLNELPIVRWRWDWFHLHEYLSKWIALLNLIAVRSVLRDGNLHDTSKIPAPNKKGLLETEPFNVAFFSHRQEGGQYNYIELKDEIREKLQKGDITAADLKREHFKNPTMGNASYSPDPLNSSLFTKSNPGARFGRNIPLSEVEDASTEGVLHEPSARKVSELLLARNGDMEKATTLNLLAAAWIQFQVHDWFNHGEPEEMCKNPLRVELPEGDNWPYAAGDKLKEADGNRAMHIRRTRRDPTRCPGDHINPNTGKQYPDKPQTFVNAETHWWDCSQIYGSSPRANHYFRSFHHGKLRTDGKTGLLPRDVDGGEISAMTANWWLGVSLMHNLFTLEHNAICDHLRGFYPNWNDEQLYRVARLVNNALMVKIHTIDWTCAILDHPVAHITMNATWWGLATEKITKSIGRISKGEMFSGIPGSSTENYDADFCMTEEFVSVYRMHPLLPDKIPLRFCNEMRPGFDRTAHERTLVFDYTDATNPDDLILGPLAMANAMKTATFADIAYTFGMEHPGAITLRNFPNWMRKLPRPEAGKMPKKIGDPDVELIDLATIDIMRDRERGVPRYNKFRKAFHLPRKKSYKEISKDTNIQKALRDVYGVDKKGRDNVDKVDLMVGLYSETPPKGFGFSETAFRVFILMASRRLKSDRFFTVNYTPEVYTKAGMDWINANNMRSVLLRHCPELAPVLHDTQNAFQPWGRKLHQSAE